MGALLLGDFIGSCAFIVQCTIAANMVQCSRKIKPVVAAQQNGDFYIIFLVLK
jgi:hypothetical protein